MIIPEEQNGAESIVYSAGVVTRSSSFTEPGFKNQTMREQIITTFTYLFVQSESTSEVESCFVNINKIEGVFKSSEILILY